MGVKSKRETQFTEGKKEQLAERKKDKEATRVGRVDCYEISLLQL